MSKNTADAPLAPETLDTARGLTATVGEARARALLGVSANAFNRAMAGLPVRYGTRLAFEVGLAAAIAAATPADLLTVDHVVLARSNGRPLGEVADGVARAVNTGGTR